MKKLRTVLMVACMAFVISFFGIKTQADQDSRGNEIFLDPNPSYTGMGTKDDPYVIYEYAALAKLSQDNIGKGERYYRLGRDISSQDNLNNDLSIRVGNLPLGRGSVMYLDLAGHEMSRRATTTDMGMFVLGIGELVINDSVGTGAINCCINRGNGYGDLFAFSNRDSYSNADGVSLTINGGTYNAADYAKGNCIYEGQINGTVTINDGAFYGKVEDVYTSLNTYKTTFYVNGGYFKELYLSGLGTVCVRDCTIDGIFRSSNRYLNAIINSASTVTVNGSERTALSVQELTGNIVISDPAKPRIFLQPISHTYPHAGTSHTFGAGISGTDLGHVTWHLLDERDREISWDTVKEQGLATYKFSKPTVAYLLELGQVKRAMDGKKLYCEVNQNGYKIKSDVVTIFVEEDQKDTIYVAGREGAGGTQPGYDYWEEEWFYNDGYTELVDGQSIWENGGQGYDNMCKAQFTYGEDFGTLELNGYVTYDNAGYENNGKLYGVYYDGNLKVILRGSNELASTNDGSFANVYGIYVTGDLIIEGSGSLSTNMHVGDRADVTGEAAGIYCGGKLTVNGGTTTSYGKTYGVQTAQKNVTVTGGKLTAKGADKALNAGVVASAPYVKGSMNVNGSEAVVATEYNASWKYALLSAVYNVVTFDANGGTGTMEELRFMSGDEVTLPECGFAAPAGTAFAGWEVNGETYQPGESLGKPRTSITAKAVWEECEEPLEITKQPRDWYGTFGKKATFTVQATGSGLSYQWQYKKNGTWNNYAITTADTETFKVTMNEKNVKWPLRCVITDASGQQAITKEVWMKDASVSAPIIITKQPADYSGVLGKKATFTVEATGNGLSYQWQYKKDNKWKPYTVASATTPILKVTMNAVNVNYPIRCKITDEDAFIAYTNEVWMRELEAEALAITKQPEDWTGSYGQKASFSIVATGESLSYQWQYKKGTTWNDYVIATADTANFRVTMNEKNVKWLFRCVVTDASGNTVTSNEVCMKLKEDDPVLEGITIISQPADWYGQYGQKASFNVVAVGEGLTYQWQYKKGTTWADYAIATADTPNFKVTMNEKNVKWSFRCVITDAKGNVVTTNEVRMVLAVVDVKLFP